MKKERKRRRARGTGTVYYDSVRDVWIAKRPIGRTTKGRIKYLQRCGATQTEAIANLVGVPVARSGAPLPFPKVGTAAAADSTTYRHLRGWADAVPFCPFRLTLTDGQTHDITHPAMIWPTRNAVLVGVPDSSAEPDIPDGYVCAPITSIHTVAGIK